MYSYRNVCIQSPRSTLGYILSLFDKSLLLFRFRGLLFYFRAFVNYKVIQNKMSSVILRACCSKKIKLEKRTSAIDLKSTSGFKFSGSDFPRKTNPTKTPETSSLKSTKERKYKGIWPTQNYKPENMLP